jgi:hypothetical protein
MPSLVSSLVMMEVGGMFAALGIVSCWTMLRRNPHEKPTLILTLLVNGYRSSCHKDGIEAEAHETRGVRTCGSPEPHGRRQTSDVSLRPVGWTGRTGGAACWLMGCRLRAHRALGGARRCRVLRPWRRRLGGKPRHNIVGHRHFW